MTEAKGVDLENILAEYAELGHKVLGMMVEADCMGPKWMTRKKILKGVTRHEANLVERLLSDLMKHGFILSKKQGWLLTLNPEHKTAFLNVTIEHKQLAAAQRRR